MFSSNCLQTKYSFAFFFTLGWYIGWKNYHIYQLKKNHFLTILEHTPLKSTKKYKMEENAGRQNKPWNSIFLKNEINKLLKLKDLFEQNFKNFLKSFYLMFILHPNFANKYGSTKKCLFCGCWIRSYVILMRVVDC